MPPPELAHAPQREGSLYTGPFGPMHVSLNEDWTATQVSGLEFEGVVEWGPHSNQDLARRKINEAEHLRRGVSIKVGKQVFRVSFTFGLTRDKRASLAGDRRLPQRQGRDHPQRLHHRRLRWEELERFELGRFRAPFEWMRNPVVVAVGRDGRERIVSAISPGVPTPPSGDPGVMRLLAGLQDELARARAASPPTGADEAAARA